MLKRRKSMPVHDSHTTRPRLASRCLSTTRTRLAHDSPVDACPRLATTRPRLARLAASRCLSTTRALIDPFRDGPQGSAGSRSTMDAETPEVDACPRLAASRCLSTTRACPRLARTTRLDSIPPISHDSARPSVSRTPIASGLRIRRSARARALAAPSRTRSGTRRQEPASRSPATPATRAPSDRPW